MPQHSLDRKRVLPSINAERELLRVVMEPGLLPNELEAAIDVRRGKRRAVLPHRRVGAAAACRAA